jgi:hypothetical protein
MEGAAASPVGSLPSADDAAPAAAATAEAGAAEVEVGAGAEVLLVSLFVRTVTDQTRAKLDGLSAGACAGGDGRFGRLRKTPRGFDYGRRFHRPATASDAVSLEADPR